MSTLNVKDYGAKGDGVTDDWGAITAAIKAAKYLDTIYLPAGTYAYSKCIALPASGNFFVGDGPSTILKASDPANSALIIQAHGVMVNKLKLTSPSATKRLDTPQSSGIFIDRATNFLIQNVTIDRMASVGIICIWGTGTSFSHSLITHNTVSNTLADGIHLTGQSAWVDVTANQVFNSGDDMFACVSYVRDGGLCHDILFQYNRGTGQSADGRGVSVVGGSHVTIDQNTITNSTGAGVYLNSESIYKPDGTFVYNLFGDDNITVTNNTLIECAKTVWQGAITIGGRPADKKQGETADIIQKNITITGNSIQNATHSGIALQGYFDGVDIEGNTIDGANEQGIYIFGGANLTATKNTILNSGSYAIYAGTDDQFQTPTQNFAFTENTIGEWNLKNQGVIPAISVMSTSDNGNTFAPSGKYPVSKPYIRYGVN